MPKELIDADYYSKNPPHYVKRFKHSTYQRIYSKDYKKFISYCYGYLVVKRRVFGKFYQVIRRQYKVHRRPYEECSPKHCVPTIEEGCIGEYKGYGKFQSVNKFSPKTKKLCYCFSDGSAFHTTYRLVSDKEVKDARKKFLLSIL